MGQGEFFLQNSLIACDIRVKSGEEWQEQSVPGMPGMQEKLLPYIGCIGVKAAEQGKQRFRKGKGIFGKRY